MYSSLLVKLALYKYAGPMFSGRSLLSKRLKQILVGGGVTKPTSAFLKDVGVGSHPKATREQFMTQLRTMLPQNPNPSVDAIKKQWALRLQGIKQRYPVQHQFSPRPAAFAPIAHSAALKADPLYAQLVNTVAPTEVLPVIPKRVKPKMDPGPITEEFRIGAKRSIVPAARKVPKPIFNRDLFKWRKPEIVNNVLQRIRGLWPGARPGAGLPLSKMPTEVFESY